MRIQIEPTDIFRMINGVKTRVWNGITEEDVQCFVFVAQVGVRPSDDCSQFEAELTEAPIAGLTDRLKGMR